MSEVCWRFLDTGVRAGELNMAIDEAVLRSVAAGRVPPTLRFYGWRPPCVSVGYFQSLESEVDLEKCSELGVETVRRPTGGRAVLHHREVTYSLVVPEEHPLLPRGVRESYALFSRGLAYALEQLGLEVELARGRSRGESAACFDAPSWFELRVKGKKITGSAQVRRDGVLLQHGSVPLEFDAELLAAVLHFPTVHKRKRAEELLSRRATSVNRERRRDGCPAVGYEVLRGALLAGWKSELGIEGWWGDLTGREREHAEELRAEKYARWEWNGRR